MPKLSPFHWALFIAGLFVYGFIVFALTRDYYLYHANLPMTAATSAPGSAVTASPAALQQQADQLFSQQRYADAVPLYRQLLARNPDDAGAYNDLGLALLYLNDKPGALSSLQTAVAKRPQLQRPWLTLGFIHLQLGNTADAKIALERARELNPETDVGKEATRLLELSAAPK